MSRRLLLTAAVVALFYCSFGQNASPYWSLSGNNNASASSKLGTTNGAPLRLFTKNVERFRIDSLGKVAIGTTFPKGKLTLFNNGSTPAASWITTANPLFTGFGEATGGNGDFFLAMASNTTTTRPNIIGRRARGTLAAPLAVADNDFITSFQASGYDGSAFQNAANIDFFADGTPTKGNVPVRISFTTGSNLSNRKERLTIKSNGYVGVGTTFPTALFDVAGSCRIATGLTIDNGGVVANTFTGYAVTGINATTGTGVYGQGYTGVLGHGNIYGVSGFGDVGVHGETTENYGTGIRGNASGTGAYGVHGYSHDSYGVFATTQNFGSYAGFFNGNVYSSGTYTSSDRSLKENITEINSAVNILKQLRPKSYSYKNDGAYKMMNLPTGIRYGLIAQDVEEVLPDIVKITEFDAVKSRPNKDSLPQNESAEIIFFKAINYTELIPILIKGVQEQQEEINNIRQTEIAALKQQNVDLRNELAELKAMVNNLSHGGSAFSVTSASLGLPNPNPAKDLAIVTYNIPPASRAAHIIVTDMKGSTIKRINLSGNSSGQVKINTGALAAGAYMYSLVVDGFKADSKQLLIAR